VVVSSRRPHDVVRPHAHLDLGSHQGMLSMSDSALDISLSLTRQGF